jgi:hypothetical protein
MRIVRRNEMTGLPTILRERRSAETSRERQKIVAARTGTVRQ